jgi:hypothetical protein
MCAVHFCTVCRGARYHGAQPGDHRGYPGTSHGRPNAARTRDDDAKAYCPEESTGRWADPLVVTSPAPLTIPFEN